MARRPRSLSRRDVIGGAAVGASMLLRPPGVFAAVPTGAVFSRQAGPTAAGAQPVIATSREFVMAGVQWTAPGGVHIELRARDGQGRWSPWVRAGTEGHGPDRPRSGAHFGEPVWFGAADAVQVRTSAPVRGLRLHFVAASAAAACEHSDLARTATALPLARPVLQAGPGQPQIIARTGWAGRGARPGGGPYYGAVQLAFVHHSENPNGYAAAQVPAMIRSIFIYHRQVRGWLDIGYNFVVDAYGRIWEARAGGIDEPVIGAQAGGYNAVSTGIAVLGSFDFAVPSAAAQEALARLLAWKLSLHGVPATGDVGVEVDPSGAFFSRYSPGRRVLLPRIAGHRDADTTDCPGEQLYARLPAIRRRAKALAGEPAVLTLTSSSADVPLAAPSVTLTGTLGRLGGGAIGGVPVTIQTIGTAGALSTVATVTTADDGSFTAPLTLTGSTVVRALYAGTPAAVSDLVVIEVTPVLTLTLDSSSPLRVSGTVTPAKRHVTLSVYQLTGAHRRLVQTRRVSAVRGTFSARLSLGRRARGTYEIVARTPLDVVSAPGASAPVTVSL